MKYEGDIAAAQQRIANTSDLFRRRLAVLEEMAPHPGERVIEVGCGNGALLPHYADAVGASGRVVGIDVSPDQIAAAITLCGNNERIELAVEDVTKLSYPDGSFDAAIAIQVIEYLDGPVDALREVRRTLVSGGRLGILATNWDTMFWNTNAPTLTAKINAAWRSHAPYPNLPADLEPMLTQAGFRLVRQTPVTVINNAYHEDAFSYWLARLIVAFVTGNGSIAAEDGKQWLEELEKSQARSNFFFSSTPLMSTAITV